MELILTLGETSELGVTPIYNNYGKAVAYVIKTLEFGDVKHYVEVDGKVKGWVTNADDALPFMEAYVDHLRTTIEQGFIKWYKNFSKFRHMDYSDRGYEAKRRHHNLKYDVKISANVRKYLRLYTQ